MRAEAHQHPDSDPSEALMREVGAQLREVRQERGEDLDDIAEYLRIKPIYLYGIERGDMSVMPGRTYALGFLRTYADYLGFDGEDLITQIKSTVANLTGKTRFHIRAPLPESRLPKMPLLVLSVAMLAGIYAGWAYLNRDDDARFEQVRPIPEPTPAPMTATPAVPPPDPAGSGDDDGTRRPAAAGAPAPVIGIAPRPDPAEGAQAAVGSQGAQGPAREPARASAADRAGADGVGADDVGREATSLEADEIAPEAGPAGSDREVTREEPPPAATASATELGPVGEQAAAGEAGGAGDADPDALGDLIARLDRPSEPAGGADPVAAAAGPEDRAGPSEAAADESAGAEDGRADQPPEALAAVAAVLASAEANDGATVHETVNSDARVIVRALGQSWMQIRSLSGDYLRTRTLEAGDAFLVPNRDDLVLWTGNAGAIEFVVDGERVTPLGSDGSVIRDIPLEPGALLERARRPG